ncbi:MAG: hypothetical protein NT027_12680 [Proteobacteria bacterium]|nr:hypothetical protein [Pseudomonadota bacterium]
MNRSIFTNFLVYLKCLIGACTLAFQIASCSANAPENGLCERSCSKRVIGGGRLAGHPVNSNVSLVCKAGTNPGTFEFNFLVYEVAASTASSGSALSIADPLMLTADDTASKVDAQTPKRIPKAGIAFRPAILGRTSVPEPPHTTTPSSEWCTDSCGYATVKVTPLCESGVVSVGIIVQGDTGEAGGVSGSSILPVSISVSKDD